MRRGLVILFLALAFGRAFAQTPAQTALPDPQDPRSWLWQYRLAGFSEKNYRAAVDALFADYERRLGHKLTPGSKRRAGLKVMTATPGLTTPVALVRAVIGALEARGFQPGELFIVDQKESSLRAAGFLSPRGQESDQTFAGVPVLSLESGRYYEPKSEANYDDAVAPSDWDSQKHVQEIYRWKFQPSDRVSLAPLGLLENADFWINLPVGIDHDQLGVCGALVNASLMFWSNTQRFFENQRSGQMAVPNIIGNAPELRNGWVFTVWSLERYQYIGGPRFDSLYNQSEPLLMLSPNPVVLDALLFERINYARRRQGFPLLDRPAYLEYARQPQFSLGDFDHQRIYLVRLP